MTRLVRLLLVAALFAAALLLSACTTHPVRHVSFHELRLAKAFKPVEIFWVGTSFQGVPLTSVDDGSDYGPTTGMNVYYGDCERGASPLDVGCVLPLQITSVIYIPHSNRGLGKYRTATFRGAPAVIFNSGRTIEVYTGMDAVDILADTPAHALAAAAALMPLNAPGLLSGDLAPPDFAPGNSSDPVAETVAAAERSLLSTDSTLSLTDPGKTLP